MPGPILLKHDTFGRIELLSRGPNYRIRRVACGSRLPFTHLIAHHLLARERRALLALDGIPGIPQLDTDTAWLTPPSLDGHTPAARDLLVRTYLAGVPLHQTRSLPEDFFDRLRDLVLTLHTRGVCHNDLHKEQNILLCDDGYPGIIDFQLASVHAPNSRTLASRAREDLRHIEKHLRRYTREGRGPLGADATPSTARPSRSWSAFLWRRAFKPLYNFTTRRLLHTRDGEPRRRSTDPFPLWTAPRGPRESSPR